jgi:hypothetical protein
MVKIIQRDPNNPENIIHPKTKQSRKLTPKLWTELTGGYSGDGPYKIESRRDWRIRTGQPRMSQPRMSQPRMSQPQMPMSSPYKLLVSEISKQYPKMPQPQMPQSRMPQPQMPQSRMPQPQMLQPQMPMFKKEKIDWNSVLPFYEKCGTNKYINPVTNNCVTKETIKQRFRKMSQQL